MKLRETLLSDLLIDAVLDDAALGMIASELARALDAPSALVQTLSRTHQTTVSSCVDPAVLMGYQKHFWQHDLWIKRKPSPLPGELVSVTDDFIPEDVMLGSEIYNDLLRPNSGIFRCLGFDAPLPSGDVLVVGVHRGHAATFTPEHVRLMQQIRPALVSLGATRERLMSSRSGLAELVLDSETDGLMVVEADGRVQFANRVCGHLLSSGLLMIRRGYLTADDPVVSAALAAGLRTACHDRRSGRLRATQGVFQVFIDPLRSGAAFSSKRPLALVRIRDEAHRRAVASSDAADALGFTPAERRLAEAMLRGASPGDYALGQGVSLATVRTHLRSVYAKAAVASRTGLLAKLSTFFPP